ncbi:hypothetical protein BKA62DRAFT_708248 [Auriculariales sp. MPI-PUGE-AT-0066]|nr:hypothetical protein BKA62DRAFT_708248 [Auriculariales sp. MPI-PUGE-AT-0066]
MEHLMWPDDREGSNVLPGASVPSDWCLGPRTATGEIDYADLKLPPPAPDDELSRWRRPTWSAPGPGLVPTYHFTHRFHCIPFKTIEQSARDWWTLDRVQCAATEPELSPRTVVHARLCSNPYGTPAPVQFPQYYLQMRHSPSGILLSLGLHTTSMMAARCLRMVNTTLLRWLRHRPRQWLTSEDRDRCLPHRPAWRAPERNAG